MSAEVRWWLTTADRTARLESQKAIEFGPRRNVQSTIEIDRSERYQSVEGFGASFTETASSLLQQKLNPDERATLLRELVDPVDGIGLNFFRQPMGATDIARDYYSYDDVPAGRTDFNLEKFSIDPDRANILPTLKEVVRLAPTATFLGTPWSPPAWMRTDQSMRGNSGGELRPDAYNAYARYFAAFIREYAAEGIKVRYVTVQNEPLYQPHYPGMLMPVETAIRFVGGHLGPTLEADGVDTGILIHDHNWDHYEAALTQLADPTVSRYIAGTAFHRYAGDASAGTIVHNASPDKGIFFTEGSTDVTISFSFIVGTVIIGSLRNWAKCIVLWNLVADEANGPYMRPGGCAICRPITTLDTRTGTWTHNDDYFALGHVSKFVRPGAVRIGSTQNEYSTLPNVAFENEDGSGVLLVLNQSTVSETFEVAADGRHFVAELPAGACATYVWSAPVQSNEQSHEGNR